MKEKYQIYSPNQFCLSVHSLDRVPKLSHKKMKTMFLSNMLKSRRLTSTFFPIIGGIRLKAGLMERVSTVFSLFLRIINFTLSVSRPRCERTMAHRAPVYFFLLPLLVATTCFRSEDCPVRSSVYKWL